MKFFEFFNKSLNREVEYYVLEDDDLSDDELANSVNFDAFDWFYHAVNELGEKGGPLKYISRSPFYKIKFSISSEKAYIFEGRVSSDLLQVIFYPEGGSLDTKNILSRSESFSLIGHLVQCVFEVFRQNKDIKRVVFIAENDKLEKFHDTMTTWIPKKYKEVEFMKKEKTTKSSYWYERIELTNEDFRYTINW